MKKFYLILVATIVSNVSFFAQGVNSDVDPLGEWTNGPSWVTAATPDCGDTVIILSGDQINVTGVVDLSGCGLPVFVEIYGTLNFSGPGSKLRLTAGSGVMIHPGGQITQAGGGGGSSKTIEIGSLTVWSSSDGTVSGPLAYGSPLPVELESFTATFNEDRVDFYWKTISERNSDYFAIERSKDGSVWDEIMTVQGAGYSTSEIEYFDYDAEPLSGKSFYRLVQYDKNGNVEKFNVVPVENLEGGLVAFNIFPNPTTTDNINLSFSGFEGKEILVVLRDISGKEYYSKVEVISTDNEIIAYSNDLTLPKGVYLVTASSENEFYSQKIIIQ